jgi:putative FmdB family regulatory protein
MPIYEYKCKKGHVFEAMQRMSDEPLTTCEKCGAPVQRVFHPIAVHFKGSGFYNTDYGTKRRQREARENSDGKSESSSESTKSETAKSDTKSSDSGSKKAESKASASSSASKSD